MAAIEKVKIIVVGDSGKYEKDNIVLFYDIFNIYKHILFYQKEI